MTQYSDFTNDFKVNPLSKNLVVLKDELAVRQSMHNLIMHLTGERRFSPLLYSNVHSRLFDLDGQFTKEHIATDIREVLQNYETRANILDVVVTNHPVEHHAIAITIKYVIKSSNIYQEYNMLLRRVR